MKEFRVDSGSICQWSLCVASGYYFYSFLFPSKFKLNCSICSVLIIMEGTKWNKHWGKHKDKEPGACDEGFRRGPGKNRKANRALVHGSMTWRQNIFAFYFYFQESSLNPSHWKIFVWPTIEFQFRLRPPPPPSHPGPHPSFTLSLRPKPSEPVSWVDFQSRFCIIFSRFSILWCFSLIRSRLLQVSPWKEVNRSRRRRTLREFSWLIHLPDSVCLSGASLCQPLVDHGHSVSDLRACSLFVRLKVAIFCLIYHQSWSLCSVASEFAAKKVNIFVIFHGKVKLRITYLTIQNSTSIFFCRKWKSFTKLLLQFEIMRRV